MQAGSTQSNVCQPTAIIAIKCMTWCRSPFLSGNNEKRILQGRFVLTRNTCWNKREHVGKVQSYKNAVTSNDI